MLSLYHPKILSLKEIEIVNDNSEKNAVCKYKKLKINKKIPVFNLEEISKKKFRHTDKRRASIKKIIEKKNFIKFYKLVTIKKISKG